MPIPTIGHIKSGKSVAGWNSYVKPFKERSLFWSAICKSAGKPINNELHQIMKKCRNEYHYQVKKVIKAQNEIKRSKLLSCLIDEGSSDIFNVVKKLRKSAPSVASVIDGKSSKVENHFSSIYQSLYNSVNDQDEVDNILKNVHENICQDDIKDVRKVTPSIVKEAVAHLQNGKSDPVYDFSSDSLKNAPDCLYRHLSIILQLLLTHSHVSLHLLLAVLVPIVKDKLGDISSS